MILMMIIFMLSHTLIHELGHILQYKKILIKLGYKKEKLADELLILIGNNKRILKKNKKAYHFMGINFAFSFSFNLKSALGRALVKNDYKNLENNIHIVKIAKAGPLAQTIWYIICLVLAIVYIGIKGYNNFDANIYKIFWYILLSIYTLYGVILFFEIRSPIKEIINKDGEYEKWPDKRIMFNPEGYKKTDLHPDFRFNTYEHLIRR